MAHENYPRLRQEDVIYASLKERIGAEIAGMLVYIPGALLVALILAMFDLTMDGNAVVLAGVTVFCVCYFGVDSVLTSSGYQGTLGHILVGLKVVDEKLEQVSLQKAIGRQVLKLLCFAVFCLPLFSLAWVAVLAGVFCLPLFSLAWVAVLALVVVCFSTCRAPGQSFHDRILKTYVLKKGQKVACCTCGFVGLPKTDI